VSHFDPTSDYRDFRGFFVLFWIGLAIMVITTMLRNLKETGYPLSMRQWGLFTQNVWEMGLSDGAMVAVTALSLPMHKIYMNSSGLLRWNRLGMAVQSIFQAGWLLFWVSYVKHVLPSQNGLTATVGPLSATGHGLLKSFSPFISWSFS
jgi:sterol O-acyltransferase